MENKPSWDYTPAKPPYPNRVMELAAELRRMRDTLAETRLLVGDYDKAIKETEFELIPAGGWPGKNDNERDIAKVRAFAASEKLQDYRNRRAGHLSIIERLEASIQSARDEMRAWELSIQDNLTMVLGGVSAFAQAAQLAGKQSVEYIEEMEGEEESGCENPECAEFERMNPARESDIELPF